MRFLLDENISRTVSRGLCDAGHDVMHVLDTRYRARPDAELIQFAKKEKRIIITHDKDFGNIILFPARNHAGVILMRLRNQRPYNALKYLLDFLSQKKKISGRLAIIRERGYMITGK